jgi:ribosomal protein L2
MRRRKVMEDFYGKQYHYKRVMELAKQEWLLSSDGVVKALQYDVKEKGFVAKIEYQKKKSTISVHEKMSVIDDWVMDTYGKDIAKKCMDCTEHQEFMEPLNQDRVFARVKLDQGNICRVKYCPEKYVHVTDDKDIEYVTNEVRVKALWKRLLDDGTLTNLNEGVIM